MEAKDRVKIITDWIKDYVESMDTPANCLVVGVSGGIDSSVVSTLCAQTGIKTLVASMPISQRPEHHELSIKHAKWLTNKYENAFSVEIDLTYPFLTFENTLTDKKFISDLGFANSKARLRMMTLYQISASTSGIVVGTGNKVEDFGVGFYTKYGDGGVDISPLADCNKSTVWAIGKELGILEEIQMAEPPDGLWSDGRTDSTQLGMNYKELEHLMDRPNEPGYEKYLAIRKKNLHKMKPIPVCKFDGKNTLDTDKKET